MNTELLKETIKKELPGLLRDDPALRAYILELTSSAYAGRQETQDRFWEVLAELRRDREEQARQWEAQNRKWEEDKQEQNRKWEEDKQAQNRKWEEDKQEQNRKWEEQNRRWDANQEEIHKLHEAIMAQALKHDRSIGALGARWGMQSEAAFRNALAGILEKSFGVEVLNITDYDDQGEVFGRPDQVELDVIIKNGLLLICELKSSIDKAGMYIFERKARFYEKRHQRQANRLIVISPMIEPRAQRVAEQLGIETFSDSLTVPSL
jgi:hypothetical protein